MSLPILLPTEFTGPLQIADALGDITEDLFEEYITKYEEIYLRRVLGDKGYIDVRDQSPLDPKYDDFINGAEYTDDDGDIRINKGFRFVLQQFLYYHYVAENWINTPTGNTQNINANAINLNDAVNKQVVYSKFNCGIDIYNRDVWPFLDHFRSVSEDVVSSVDNGGGAYTINLIDTTYLVNGDTVTINSIEYVITNVTVDTSFDISGAATGLDFSSETATWEPFGNISWVKYSYNWL